ncbi:MAG: MBL fold metallo-hydrolase [Peptostreptococcaceae bacterium]|nr:MBL fold metallo-hydrolase [Peptostreptococcaceae bacterium]
MNKRNSALKYYLDSTSNALEFHILNVGQGLMILIIFPDETTMLFDCFIKKETQETILSYIEKNIPKKQIDIFVNSHRDLDHYKGIQLLNEKFPIKSIWDSGQYGSGAKSRNTEYENYMKLKRKIKKDFGEDAVPKLEASNCPFRDFGGAKIFCLNSKDKLVKNINLKENTMFSYNVDFYENPENSYKTLNEAFFKSKNQHTNCIVLLIEFKNKKLLLTGDSDWKCWKESIFKNCIDKKDLKSNILIASHHGSRSFFTEESENGDINIEKNPETTFLEHIQTIKPDITLISCGKYEQHHHPNEEALNIYKKHTSNEQVYTTFQESAHFIGFINETGYWGVMTSDFTNYKNDQNLDFKLSCFVDNYDYEKENSITLDGNHKLIFKATNFNKITDNRQKENVIVKWMVSNSGKAEDENRQEIYTAGESIKKINHTYTLNRDLMFKGTHLLQCSIENLDRNKKITKIFKVTKK